MSAYPTKASDVNTLEKEIIRLLLAYQEANPKTIMNEAVNEPEPVGQWWMRQVPSGELVFIGRATIVLDRPLLNSGVKLWYAAKEMPGGAVVPTSYTD